MSYRGNFPRRGRGSFRGKRMRFDRDDSIIQRADNIPRAKADHELVTDGTAKSRAVSRARDDRRVAKDWQTYYEDVFEKRPMTIRLPQNSHLIPESEVLNETLRNIADKTITDWRGAINEHIQALISRATEREANPPPCETAMANPETLFKQLFASEGFAKLIAVTVANTTQALAEKKD